MYINKKGGARMGNLENKEILAKNLNYYKKKSGKSQKELAEIAGVATSTFSEWTNGKKYPRMDKIELLADYFGILKSDLIEDKKELKKINDTAVDIVDRIMDTPSIYPLVDRMLEDREFLCLVKSLNNLDSKKIKGVLHMLDSFL